MLHRLPDLPNVTKIAWSNRGTRSKLPPSARTLHQQSSKNLEAKKSKPWLACYRRVPLRQMGCGGLVHRRSFEALNAVSPIDGGLAQCQYCPLPSEELRRGS
eukprot:6455928-Amphidinium_carterae.1